MQAINVTIVRSDKRFFFQGTMSSSLFIVSTDST
ncbi:uncharacterized protein METZ01_LOCUS456213, partial [marine metagenome]